MKKFFKICLAIVAISLCVVPAAYARIVHWISYQEFFEKSDLVVIATPLTKTLDTSERTYFEGIVETGLDGKQTSVEAIGVETTFSISVVMKGDRDATQFVLHHYRPSALAVDGPNVVSFDPFDPRRTGDVLLFLLRERDGRYAPYGGQLDPGIQAITTLGP
jgi:hypothetical protein